MVLTKNHNQNQNKNAGYVYCFSNPSWSGKLKIGMTLRTPDKRLKEANSYTFMPSGIVEVTELVCAKFVANAKQEEKRIHTFFKEQRAELEFFNVSPDIVMDYLDSVDGEWWDDTEYDVEDVLDRRWNRKKQTYEFLVRWTGYGVWHDTWEPYDGIKHLEQVKHWNHT